MIIGGLQKMTMLDFPGKVACTVFTYGCNMRCPFCHNASLVVDKAELYSEEEIFEYLKKRKGILDGVCITGGEPMLQKDLFDFMRKIKELGLLVKLDTNGTFPELLERAIELTYDEKVLELIADKSFDKKFGARDIRKAIRKDVEDKVANEIIEHPERMIKKLHITADESGKEIIVKMED